MASLAYLQFHHGANFRFFSTQCLAGVANNARIYEIERISGHSITAC